ncbi:uncharacterized protein LACBIDRAFT_296763 [Laccaria bicolor S238N-H82]|uniref:Predicted protein n=1 Tax=Laccaria bicolor (strain S238N-H82 / ATCC MYA-4686) TaxID=486041 RepID=B0E320_LACBS|nr:uncharacterized protein LACBIDRAFT_296763 [Laccaria bicolor S238N-H82]EDQ98759.1 predicted protein [Laccaria bicolor S238N-H82]|eukprot:XP_001890591.1 predicted protein [Laccaria bicolor S238N-H82]
MTKLTDNGAPESTPLPASLAIDELFARLDIGPQTARTILRALLTTAYSDTPAPVSDFRGDALEVLGFGASDPNYASDDEEIVVVDPTTSPAASPTSSATLRPASPADLVNSIRSIATDSAPAVAPVVVAPVASAVALASADVLASVDLSVPAATHAAARPAAPVPSSAITATANNAAPVASATDTASAATPNATNSPPLGTLTASTALLYLPNYVLPYNAPKNAILPPPSLVTPVYGYHVPGPNESGPFYMASRGRNIGIFSGWEILSPFVTGVSHSAFSKVSGIQEGHARMAVAINAGFATYLT